MMEHAEVLKFYKDYLSEQAQLQAERYIEGHMTGQSSAEKEAIVMRDKLLVLEQKGLHISGIPKKLLGSREEFDTAVKGAIAREHIDNFYKSGPDVPAKQGPKAPGLTT